MTMEHILELDFMLSLLSLFGIAVFAVSGALDAARKGMDILGFILIGTVTGLGGGTIRDILLGNVPVYWIMDAIYVGLCIFMSIITYFIAPKLASRAKTLIWMDALGLSLFCVTGTQIAATAGAPPLISICMGVVTASFGGIIRDVLCGYDLILGNREFYVTVAVVGGSTYGILHWVGAVESLAMIAGILAAFSLRSAAIIWGWSLPSYQEKK